MTFYIAPEIKEKFDELSNDIKERIRLSGAHIENMDELGKALLDIDEKNQGSDYFPDITNVSSPTEATGLIPASPINEAEYDSYLELYDLPFSEEE